MDREQAIKIIKDCKEKSFNRTLYTLNEYYEAVDMAIKALEQQPCEDAIHNEREQAYIKGYEDASKRYRTEPCDNEELDFVQPHKKIKVNLIKFDTPYTDAISRQAAIDAIREETCGCAWDAKYILKHLPSVTVQEKAGRWEKHSYFKDAFICSACNTGGNRVYKDFKYCPNCGAKMIEPQENEIYCERHLCVSNEYNGIGCDECEVTKSREPQESEVTDANSN